MKLSIANPVTGCQKLFDIEDEKKLRIFYDQRIASEVDASPLGDQFKGYVVRITGGSDKEGFPMKQGVLVNGRVRLLLSEGTVGFQRAPHKPIHAGSRRRRTVRGCIVGNDMSVLNLIIVKKGEQEIEGLTDKSIPRRVGPKRASKIRRLFNLTKDDDVRKYVVPKVTPNKSNPSGRPHTKIVKIQRLVTPERLQRRRREWALLKKRWNSARAAAKAYKELLTKRSEAAQVKRTEAKEARKTAAKTKRLLAIRRVLEKRYAAKLSARAQLAKKIDAKKKRREALKAVGKLRTVWTAKQKLNAQKQAQARRRSAYLEARGKLTVARRRVVINQRRDQEELSKAIKVGRKGCPKAKLAKLYAKVAESKKNRPAIMTKEGAAKFLGKAMRPFNKTLERRKHGKEMTKKIARKLASYDARKMMRAKKRYLKKSIRKATESRVSHKAWASHKAASRKLHKAKMAAKKPAAPAKTQQPAPKKTKTSK